MQEQFTTRPIYQKLITEVYEDRLRQLIEERDTLSEKFLKLYVLV